MIPGEPYWVQFPPTDGHEQAGRRPAIVLQDDAVSRSLPVVLIAPVTGTTANLRYPGTVLVRPTPDNGLYKDSVILVFQTRAMDLRRFGNRIGFITPTVLSDVHTALDRLLGRVRPTAGSSP